MHNRGTSGASYADLFRLIPSLAIASPSIWLELIPCVVLPRTS